MKAIQKWITCFLLVSLLLVLIGCNGEKTPTPSPSPNHGSPSPNTPGITPTVVTTGDPYEFSYMGRIPDAAGINTEFARIWQEKCNIRLRSCENIGGTGEEYNERLLTYIATGTLPELVGDNPNDQMGMRMLAQSGENFANLQPYLEEIAPHYAEIMRSRPDFQRRYLSDEGAIYVFAGVYEQRLGKTLWINKNLLEQLNMEYSFNWTVYDIYDFLRAIKNNSSYEPQPIDEFGDKYPFTMRWAYGLLAGPQDMFGYRAGWTYNPAYNEDSYVNYLFMDIDKTKTYLNYVKMLVDEKLLDTGWQEEKIIPGLQENLIGLIYEQAERANLVQSGNLNINCMPIVPPINPDGQRGFYEGKNHGLNSTYYINKNANVRYLVKAMNWLFTEEAIHLNNWGPEEYHVHDPETGEVIGYSAKYVKECSTDGENATGPDVPEDVSPAEVMRNDPNFQWADNTRFQPLGIRGLLGVFLRDSFEYGRKQEFIECSYYMEYYDAYAPLQPTLFFTPDEHLFITNKMTEIHAAAGNFTFEDFVYGRVSMDLLDNFPQAYENLGGDQVLAYYNAALARFRNRQLLYT